jgi:hypothetical protein
VSKDMLCSSYLLNNSRTFQFANWVFYLQNILLYCLYLDVPPVF